MKSRNLANGINKLVTSYYYIFTKFIFIVLLLQDFEEHLDIASRSDSPYGISYKTFQLI
mgnify:CR=1 FL=1